jgi:hypothetical protein
VPPDCAAASPPDSVWGASTAAAFWETAVSATGGSSFAAPACTDAASGGCGAAESSIVQYSIIEAQPDSAAENKTIKKMFAARFAMSFILSFLLNFIFPTFSLSGKV